MSTGPWPRALVGRVVKTAMQKSVLVRCERMKLMNKTKRLVARHRNFMVHDEEGKCKVGDTVRIKEVRRISKQKKHTLVEIIRSEHIKFESIAQ
jgi:small subunit ribosomal protein S17